MFYKTAGAIIALLLAVCVTYAQTGAPNGTVPLGTGGAGFNYVAPGALNFTATDGTAARSLQDRAGDTINLKDFTTSLLANGKADGYHGIDGAITTGTANFTSAGRACNASTDVGKIIEIAGAGATVSTVQQPLETTINSCSGSTFVLAANAGNTVTGATWVYGTDYSAALAAAATASRKKKLMMPSGIIMLRSTSVALSDIHLACPGARNSNSTDEVNLYGEYGTVFAIASTTVAPFYVTNGTAISGCNFFWPGQMGINANPVVYQPLLSGNNALGLGGFVNFLFENNTVLNAYDFLYQATEVGSGNIRITNNNIYAVRRVFSMTGNYESMFITNLVSNPSIFTSHLGPAANLAEWTNTNGEWFYVYGDGVGGGACDASHVMGGIVGNGLTIQYYRYAVHVVGGHLDESQFTLGSSRVGTVLGVESGGNITNTMFDSRYYVLGSNGTGFWGTNSTAFYTNTTCTGSMTGQNDFVVSGQLAAAVGTIVDIQGTHKTEARISNLQVLTFGGSSIAGDYYAVHVNNAAAKVMISDNIFADTYAAGSPSPNNAKGILVQSAADVSIIGNVFDNLTNPIDTNGAGGTVPISVIGNVTLNTRSTNTVVNVSGGVRLMNNRFDKEPQTFLFTGIGTITPIQSASPAYSPLTVKGGTDQNIVVLQNTGGADPGAIGIASMNDVANAYMPLAFLASRYHFVGSGSPVTVDGSFFGGGHVGTMGAAPALTSCGTGSPAISGTDTAGEVTMGTTATGCVITFAAAYTGVPYCVVTWPAQALASQSYAVSASAITLTQTSTSGNKVYYHCIARSGG